MTRLVKFTWLWVIVVGLAAAGCEGLAGEPQVVATLPPESVSSSGVPDIAGVAQVTPDAALGARIYAENCTRCHGITGRGDGEMVQSGQVVMPVDFTNPAVAQNARPEDWYQVITEGRLDKLMPPWKDALSEAERWAVTNYLFTLSANQQLVTGPVSGQIVNGTAGGVIPGGMSVTLHIIDQHARNDETREAVVNPDGSFRFDDIPLQANKGYAITTEYQGGQFVSNVLPGDPTAGGITLDVPIYDFSSDPSIVTIDRMVAQVSVENNRLQVTQIISLVNNSDRAYRAADGQSSVQFALPAGAQPNTAMNQGGRFVYGADGATITDTVPVMPNAEHTIHLAYSLPYTDGMSLQQPFTYAVSQGYDILLDTPGVTLEGDGIEARGGIDANHGAMMRFTNSNALPAGANLSFTVSGTPILAPEQAVVSNPPTTPILPLLFIGAGVLTIGAAGALYWVERRRTPLPAAAGITDAQTRINDLVREIAALDVEFQAKRIKNKVYQSQRSALKSELMKLVKEKEA